MAQHPPPIQCSRCGTAIPGSNWDSSYRAVYHLRDGATLSAGDSTAGGNNGSLVNGASATAGQVGGGASFTAANSQYIDLGNSPSIEIAGAITVEAWIKYTG